MHPSYKYCTYANHFFSIFVAFAVENVSHEVYGQNGSTPMLMLLYQSHNFWSSCHRLCVGHGIGMSESSVCSYFWKLLCGSVPDYETAINSWDRDTMEYLFTRIIQQTIEIWASDSKNQPIGQILQYLLFCCSAALLAVCVHY